MDSRFIAFIWNLCTPYIIMIAIIIKISVLPCISVTNKMWMAIVLLAIFSYLQINIMKWVYSQA